MAIFRANESSAGRSITWDDILNDWQDGLYAVEACARKKLSFQVLGKEIVIRVVGTPTVYRYPLAGPKVYNAALGP